MTKGLLLLLTLLSLLSVLTLGTKKKQKKASSAQFASVKARQRARIGQLRFGNAHTKIKEDHSPSSLNGTSFGNYENFCWDGAVFGATPHPLTFERCRKGVPLRGSDHHSRRLLDRLRTGACLRVVVLGGSVSWGFGAHAHKKPDRGVAWPEHLRRKLNADYPCGRNDSSSSNGSSSSGSDGHIVENLSVRGVGSSYWELQLSNPTSRALAALSPPLSSSSSSSTGAGVDLILVETAANDFEGAEATYDTTKKLPIELLF